MDKQSSSNNTLKNRRFILGIVSLLLNLVILFKTLDLPTKYIIVVVNMVIIIAVLVKIFNFTFSKILVAFIIVSNFVYAFAIIKLVGFGGMEPSALTVAFYAFTTVELWNLAGIRNKKEETKQKEIMYGEDDSNYG